jgi:catalase
MTDPFHPLRRFVGRAREKLSARIELALVAAIIATVAIGLAYTAGWISPGPITPVTIIEALQARDGFRTGFPRAKAGCLGQVCANGEFLKGAR